MPSNPRPNIESIKDIILSDEAYTRHPFAKSEGERSYKFEIINGKKHLYYFGSAHTNKIGDPLFTEIKAAFDGTKPQLVLVEGVESINSNKEETMAKGKKMSLEDSIKYGESGYALKLAIDAGIDFESPEPSFNIEIQMLLDSGYSKKDIFNFYMYRSVYQYQRENQERSVEGLGRFLKFHSEKFNGWSENEIGSFVNELYSGIELNSQKYEKSTDPIPWKGQKQLVTNEIARASSNFRDKYIIGKMAEALKRYDKIFVVYGASHAVKQEPAIRALLA